MKDQQKNKLWPATLYVEGQDQFRGWFNSSLITSTILTGRAPYKQVLSHGFVVDEKGIKISKLLGNFIDPEEIVKKFGTDVLRLWVASSDFTKEIKTSIPILENLRESYQKIRNTLRFLLGNLANMSLEIKNEESLEKELSLVDCYILCQLEKLTIESRANYRKYDFTPIYFSLLKFCVNDLSAFYFEISKDSLYCDSLYSKRRKQIITTLYYSLQELLKIILPILPFLAEEVYKALPFNFGFANQESVFLIDSFSNFDSLIGPKKRLEVFSRFFFLLRQKIYQALEMTRQKKIINTNSQADITVYLKNEKNKIGGIIEEEISLETLLSVAKIRIEENELLTLKVSQDNFCWEDEFCLIKVKKTDKKKCMRCWNFRDLKDDYFCFRCSTFINPQSFKNS